MSPSEKIRAELTRIVAARFNQLADGLATIPSGQVVIYRERDLCLAELQAALKESGEENREPV